MLNKGFRAPMLAGVILTLVASGACAFFSLPCAGICLLAGVLYLLLYGIYTKRRYQEIALLNEYLSRVFAGEYDLEVCDNAEGELSILKNNLYKMMMLLRSQNEALRKDKTYLADSLADISHQLKTPLTSILVMTDLLKVEKAPENRKRFSEIIEAQAEKMNWLIVTLLKISKLDAGTTEFQNVPVRLQTVLTKALKPFLVTAELRNITLDCAGVADFSFQGDENWSAEAIGNIVKNCLEHMADGGTLTFASKSNHVYDQLSIVDDGCGIPPQELPHIFERFYHGKSATPDSVGIGLALAKSVFNQEHATIEVESTPGVGTKFCIKFYKSVL